MDNSYVVHACASLLAVLISSYAQVLLKKSSQIKYASVIREYLNWLVITAYSILFLATLLSVYAYRVLPLSLGPVFEATSYVYITIFSVTVFHEKISKQKIVALIFIMCGIVIFTGLG